MEGKSWFDRLTTVLGLGSTQAVDPDWPDWFRTYFQDFHPQSPDTPIERVNFIVLDAETTGLDLKKDKLISLGGLRVTNNTIHVSNHFEGYLPYPGGGHEAVAIHGIIPQSSRYTYSNNEELMRELTTYLASSVIVGHSIGFDLSIINRSLDEVGGGQLVNQVLDTGKLAQKLRPAGYWTPPGEYTLDKLAGQYRIPLSDRHTALGDSYITAVLLLKLLARLRERRGKGLRLGDVL